MRGIIFINNNEVELNEEENILDVAINNKIEIPNLCYLKDSFSKGDNDCCLVEIEGKEELFLASQVKAVDGMKVYTDTERVQAAVKEKIGGLLDKHEFKCGQCKRKDNCELLKVVIKTKSRASKPFIVKDKSEYVDDRSKSIVIDRSKCIACGRCEAACKTKTGTCSVKLIDGKRVEPTDNKCFDDTNCLLCGQCVIACPVDGISEKLHMERVKQALEDPEMHVIVAMAPAVRTAMGELFKMGYGVDTTGKLYTVLRMLGFDKIFDINFGADMTIMEETTEFLSRVEKGGPFPMFTSCCPAWVRQVENYFPQYLSNLSTTKSPQQILGTASKTYYPEISDLDPKKVFTVTIMPCTAKKYEADRDDMENEGLRNIDAVLTTRELAQMIKAKRIKFETLEDSEADPMMGEYTGAGAIFGATGGVMEAAIRSAKDFYEGEDLQDIEYTVVRGLDGIKEATIMLGMKEINVAVINGSNNLFKFMESGMLEKKQYHFIEVMACEGGCVNGGGQPHLNPIDRENIDIRKVRASVLYNQDKHLAKRKSHQNAALLKMYETYMGKPGHGKAHELLHVKSLVRNK